MKLEIIPYQSMGPIYLNKDIDHVIVALGKPKGFRDNKVYTNSRTYYFDEGTIHVEVDPDGIIIAIETTRFNDAYYGDFHFIGVPYEKVKAWFEERDDNPRFNGAGLVSEKLGIGVYAPYASSHPEDPVEAVIVFVRDYYKK